jgi:hypothetical protein
VLQRLRLHLLLPQRRPLSLVSRQLLSVVVGFPMRPRVPCLISLFAGHMRCGGRCTAHEEPQHLAVPAKKVKNCTCNSPLCVCPPDPEEKPAVAEGQFREC